MIHKALMLIFFSGMIPIFIQAQVITNVPPTVANERYFDEIFTEMKRPGLSIIGFDNGGDHSKGFGLKQILNQAYVSGSNEQKELFIDIINEAKIGIETNPINSDDIEVNSNILKYLAFEALCSYILEENGITSTISNAAPYNIPIRDHQTVINSFKYNLLPLLNGNTTTGNDLVDFNGADYIEHVDTYQNIARMIDLYLALENAYTKWPGHTGNTLNLLSQSQKQDLMEAYISGIQKLYEEGVHQAYPHESFGLVYVDDLEPGNRPLKGHVALGYSVLAIQNASGWNAVDDYFNRARNRAGSTSNGDRIKYWGYQSSDEQKEWAEGAYYFNFALKTVVPFWHAVRANNLLGAVSNPFSNDWFLNPIEWLADTSTPDGLSIPLEDGHKENISSAPMLRWSSIYGREIVGRKFNYIFNTNNYYKSVTSQNYYNYQNVNLLVELAIPKTDQEEVIDYSITNETSGPKILRHTDGNGNLHYIVLNGEKGNTISRGEGHEHPDQLQLLYYINDKSYLIDTGYISNITLFPSFSPSQFNGWRNHNVMWFGGDTDFLSSPVAGWTSAQGFKLRVVSDFNHPDILNFSFASLASKVELIKGKINGNAAHNEYDGATGQFRVNFQPVEYERDILFIKGTGLNDTYLIDLNIAKGGEAYRADGGTPDFFVTEFSMNYYTGTNSYSNLGDWKRLIYQNDNDLFISLNPVEYTGTVDVTTFYNTAEYQNFTKDIKRVSVSRQVESDVYESFYNTVGFLNVSSVSPYSVEKIFNNSSGPNYHQAWYLKHDSNTLDVFVKRSKINMNSYNQNININIDENNFKAKLQLSAGIDYGFVRLKKQNGIPKIDINYNVNMNQYGYLYTSNHIIGNYTYPSGSHLYVGDNVTLKFTGTVDLSNSKVFLGENARIEVRNGGQLTATNTEFKRLDAGKEHDGVRLYTSNNVFTNSSIDGGYYGLYSYYAHGHTITNSTFEYNRYGLYFYGSDNIALTGVISSGNSYDGMRLYNAEVTTQTYHPTSHAWPVFTTFSNNGSNGIDMDSYAKLWMYETILENNSSHDITLGTNSRAYTGSNYYSTSSGHNKFGVESSPGRYIYSVAMTGTSENQTSWTVPARHNYWEDGTAPSSSQFYGSVSYSNHLTEDPTFYDPHPSVRSEEEAPEVVLSANVANQAAKSAHSEMDQQKILQIKQRLLELEGLMQENETTLLNGRWLKTYAGLLKYLDQGVLVQERNQVRGWQNQWLGRFHAINTLTADSLAEEEQAGLSWQAEARGNPRNNPEGKRGSTAPLEAAQIVGETAVILEVEEALEKDQFNRVTTLYEKYGPYVANKDNQMEFLSGLSLAYQNQKEYGKALATILEMENIKPDKDMAEHWEALDFYEVKKMLNDSAKAHNQDVVFEKATPSAKTKEVSSVPEEFELLNAYPNPFNPTAVIAFSLPKEGKVRVEVYNMAGKLVSVLVNSNYPAGVHQIRFDGGTLSSGVYIIRAEYNGSSLTQKITLIK